MTANDLRIGNFIYWNIPEKKNVIHTVIGIINDKPLTLPISYGDSMEDYRPIPLTIEILEKARFVRDTEGWYLSAKNKLYDPLTINGVGGYSQSSTALFAFKHGGNILKRGVLYVHQLQNLYFALTGEELNINL